MHNESQDTVNMLGLETSKVNADLWLKGGLWIQTSPTDLSSQIVMNGM